MPDTPADAPGTTFTELTNYWHCYECNIWYDDSSRECEYCEIVSGQTYERGTIYPVVFECTSCHCIATPDGVAEHDCEMCSL